MMSDLNASNDLSAGAPVGDFFDNAKTPDTPGATPAISAEELAAFREWQAANGGAAVPVDETATEPALELDDSAYAHAVGDVVSFASGFGVVVTREPVAGPDGAAVAGYRVSPLSPPNDSAAPSEALGIQE
jgi:hypothetical protein